MIAKGRTMLLIDGNNRPTNTVYYLSAVVYDQLSRCDDQYSIRPSDLYGLISDRVLSRKVNIVFFIMALDFLFLLDKLEIDREGQLHVH